MARLVDRIKAYLFPYVFYFLPIRFSSSWDAFEGDGLYRLVLCHRQSASSHGGVNSVVEEVVQDMGFRESEFVNKMEVIEALLGGDGMPLLECSILDSEYEPPLRGIIEDELEEEDFDNECFP